ncbi:MAG: tetratricopeptide repeat protein, partial [Thermoplasmata archaeon]
HRKASQALEKIADNRDEHVFQLAEHYYKSGEVGLALNYLLKSAKRAADTYAYEDAISYYKKAMQIASNEEEAKVKLELAEIYKYAGEWESALELYRTAYSSLKDNNSRARARRGIAYIMSKRGGWPEAEHAYIESITLSKDVKDEEGVAEALLGLGWSYWRQGKYDMALEKYIECLDIADRLESKEL